MPRLCPSEPIALPLRLAGETKRQCLRRAGAALCLNAQSPKQATLPSPCLCAGFFFFFLESLSLTPAPPWLLLVWPFAVTQDWSLITF